MSYRKNKPLSKGTILSTAVNARQYSPTHVNRPVNAEKRETFVLRHLTQIKSSQMGRQRFINALKNLSKLCLVHHFQFFQDKQFTLPPRHKSRTVEPPPPQTETNLIFRVHFWLVNPECTWNYLMASESWRERLFQKQVCTFSFTRRRTLYYTFKVSERFQASFAVSNCARPWFKWKSFFKITQRFFSKGLQHKVGGHFFPTGTVRPLLSLLAITFNSA